MEDPVLEIATQFLSGYIRTALEHTPEERSKHIELALDLAEELLQRSMIRRTIMEPTPSTPSNSTIGAGESNLLPFVLPAPQQKPIFLNSEEHRCSK